MISPAKRIIAGAVVAAALLCAAAVEAFPRYGETLVASAEDYGRASPPGDPFDPDLYVAPAGDYYARGYDTPPPIRYRARNYRNADYGPPAYVRGPARYRCDRGTGGTIIGAIAGGLLGNGVAGRGDRTAGAIIGAGVGALAGRAIDRDC